MPDKNTKKKREGRKKGEKGGTGRGRIWEKGGGKEGRKRRKRAITREGEEIAPKLLPSKGRQAHGARLQAETLYEVHDVQGMTMA